MDAVSVYSPLLTEAHVHALVTDWFAGTPVDPDRVCARLADVVATGLRCRGITWTPATGTLTGAPGIPADRLLDEWHRLWWDEFDLATNRWE